MSIFALILYEEDPKITKKIKANFKKYHEMTPTTFFVVSGDFTEDVAVSAGIKGEDHSITGGIVFKLDGASAGYAHPSVWEWLKDQREHF